MRHHISLYLKKNQVRNSYYEFWRESLLSAVDFIVLCNLYKIIILYIGSLQMSHFDQTLYDCFFN